jgi:hypothetical protein
MTERVLQNIFKFADQVPGAIFLVAEILAKGMKPHTTGETLIRPAYVLFFIYFNCKWVFTRWQWYYNKTQHTNNTHHTK